MNKKAENFSDIKVKRIKSKMTIWILCCLAVFLLYGGMLIIEALFFDGNMRVAVISIVVSSPIILIAFFAYFKMSNVTNILLIITAGTQLIFLTAGTYLQELNFYFFVMLLVLGTAMIMKDFKILAKCVIITFIINVAAIIFLIPKLDWINHYRFFIEFLFFLFGAIFFMFITRSVEQKENNAEQASLAFVSLLNSTPNYMVITDSLKRVRYISEPMAQFAYFPSQELAVGRPLFDLFSDKKLKLMFADILDAGNFIEKIMSIDIEGEERHFKVIADKLSGETGGLFIDISDITQTINSKRTAEEAQARAEAASAFKSKFLATMSHEIRTPMNAIIGIAQIQLQKGNLTSEQKDALEKVHNSCSSLLGIINDILDLSKIETGKMEINFIEYDLPSLINDTVQLNVVRIGSKAIEFILDVDETLPIKLIGDELRIKQVLNNLLSNAIKYTEKGYIKLSIRHIAFQEDRIFLLFFVEDTGQGMKPKDCQNLFSEYSRFNLEANRSTEGTGIGLNITRNIIKLMEGTIEVKSEYGKGSIFSVKIKQKKATNDIFGNELTQKLKNFKYYGEKRFSDIKIDRVQMPYGKVLIVDDVETNIYVAEGLMSFYGLQIEKTLSAFGAIEKIEHGSIYDIIFMDHMMPVMDGIEATQKIRAMGYKGVIVALTANTLVGNAEMFKENGFDDFISKPIDFRHLNNILNKYIKDRHPGEVNPELMEIFCRDAVKAIITLRATFAKEDYKQFTTTAHAMKSALGNILEIEKSKIALSLEEAGTRKDKEFISKNIENFINCLESIINNSKQLKKENNINSFIHEDKEYLIDKLLILKKACDDCNDTEAYSILDQLKEKHWRTRTLDKLKKIRDMLFLHSDFEDAAKLIDAEIKSIKFKTNIKISGVDAESGLALYNDEMEIYITVLRAYVLNALKIINNIRIVSEETLKDYIIYIHGLKGINANIGAENVKKTAQELENMGRSGNLTGILSLNELFIKDMENVIFSVKSWLDELDKLNPKPLLPYPDRTLLIRLRISSENYDIGSIDKVMDELESANYETDASLVIWLRKKINESDFSSIISRLKAYENVIK